MKMSKDQFNTIRKDLDNNKYIMSENSSIIEVFMNINNNSPLEYILIFSKEVKLKKLRFLDVSQFKRDDGRYSVRFVLNMELFVEQFHILFDDLTLSISRINDVHYAQEVFIKRFNQWILLFDEDKIIGMKKTEAQAIFGELYILNKLLSNSDYNESEIIEGWKGPLYEPKDFVFSDSWIEVKTVLSGNNKIKISSIEQLDADIDGTLIVLSFDRISNKNKCKSLNKLIDEVLSNIRDSHNYKTFFERLMATKIIFGDTLMNLELSISNEKQYLVNNEFPSMRRNEIVESIIECKYILDLITLEEYEIKDDLEGGINNNE